MDLNIYECCFCGKRFKHPCEKHACECSHGDDFRWLSVELDPSSKTFKLSEKESRVIMKEDRFIYNDDWGYVHIRWSRTCIPERVDEFRKILFEAVRKDMYQQVNNIDILIKYHTKKEEE